MMRQDAVQSHRLETMPDQGERRLGAVAAAPVVESHPVAELGPAMQWLDIEPDGPGERPILPERDREDDRSAGRKLVLVRRDPGLGKAALGGMRDGEGGGGDLARAGQPGDGIGIGGRSEERRVGKGWKWQ